jgi:hypothetical protein
MNTLLAPLIHLLKGSELVPVSDGADDLLPHGFHSLLLRENYCDSGLQDVVNHGAPRNEIRVDQSFVL